MSREMTEAEKANFEKYGVATEQNPAVHGPTPFRLFDPGKGDPWRELCLVDANNHSVTTLGPLMDTTDMTLGNALFILECCNKYEDLKKLHAMKMREYIDVQSKFAELSVRNKQMADKIVVLEHRLKEVKSEV